MTKSVEDRFWPKVDKSAGPDGCWLWLAACGSNGYGRFDHVEGSSHRVAWTLTNGPIPKRRWVLHHCDVRLCVNPAHLFLGTREDNAQDSVNKGRQAKGEAQGSSKLTEEEVLEIREEYAPGDMLQQQLADAYGVSPSQIHKIVHREYWTLI